MDNKLKQLGTWIHGIASTEHLDSSGERVKLDGINISSLPIDGLFNYEHESKNSSNIVGKIIIAKKIYKEEDCESNSEKYFFEKSGRKPYLYVLGVLFDSFGHRGAQEIKAHMDFDKAMDGLKSNPILENTRYVVGFSIEGGKLETSPNMVKKCIARKVSITNLPCNKVCSAEIFNDFNNLHIKDINPEKLVSTYKKSEEDYFEKADNLKNIYMPNKASAFNAQKQQQRLNSRDKYVQGIGGLKNNPVVPKATQSDVFSNPANPKSDVSPKTSMKLPSGSEWKAKIQSKLKGVNKSSNFRKSIISGTKDILQKEKISKSILDDAFDNYKNKDMLVKHIQDRYNLNQIQALEISKKFAYSVFKKQEKDLEQIINSNLK